MPQAQEPDAEPTFAIASDKSVALAVTLSIFFPGAGQLYVGRRVAPGVAGGIATAICDLISIVGLVGFATDDPPPTLLWLPFAILSVVLRVYAPIDAGVQASAYNDERRARVGVSATAEPADLHLARRW
ncbi:MAG: hypothetical protein IT379_11945 [Deltaproteobacteria bacterium]|nr:hypothetical protein [Deltaproteobacteria bacterium]